MSKTFSINDNFAEKSITREELIAYLKGMKDMFMSCPVNEKSHQDLFVMMIVDRISLHVCAKDDENSYKYSREALIAELTVVREYTFDYHDEGYLKFGEEIADSPDISIIFACLDNAFKALQYDYC